MFFEMKITSRRNNSEIVEVKSIPPKFNLNKITRFFQLLMLNNFF